MILGFLALGLIAYTWAKTDPGGTWSTTRAAGGAGLRTGGRSARSTWDRRRPDRAKQRAKRRKQWERSGLIGWSLVQAERGTVGLARLAWDGSAATGRAVWDGGRAARDEWRTTWKAHHPEPTEGGPAGGPDRSTDHPAGPRCSWTVSPGIGGIAVGPQIACGRPATDGPFCAKHAAESTRTPCARCGRPLGSNPACPECGRLSDVREPQHNPWPETPLIREAREPVLVGGGAIAAADGRAATPRIDHTPPAGDPIPSPRPAVPPIPEPPDSAPAPAEAPASTDSPFSHGGPPGMSTATVTPGTGTDSSSLSAVRRWCAAATSEITEGNTGALVAQGSQLYEGFDGAIARIEGEVGQAATHVQELAAQAKEVLTALIEALNALDQTCAAAIGD